MAGEAKVPDTVVPGDDESKTDPIPDTDSADAELDAARQQYRQELEVLGARFDAEGELVGWNDDTPPSTQTPSPQPKPTGDEAGDDSDEADRLRAEMASMRADDAPVKIKVLVDAAIEGDPSFDSCRKEATQFLSKIDPSAVNANTVKAALLMARGVKTPLLIAEAKSGMKKDSKVAAAAAAGVDIPSTSGGGDSGVKHAKITPTIQTHADAWGLDPQVLADNIAAEKARPK